MKHQENYKKAIDQIHPSEELQKTTLEKMQRTNKKKTPYMKYLAACAIFIVICLAGELYFEEEKLVNSPIQSGGQVATLKNEDLPRFKDMNELKDVLYQYTSKARMTNGLDSIIAESETALTDSAEKSSNVEDLSNKDDYSKTNVQVENVDEADIVKTDGAYIYYVSENGIYILQADTLAIIATIKEDSENTQFYPKEIFVYQDKMIALGNEFISENMQTSTMESVDSIQTDVARIRTAQTAKAKIYDISQKDNPVLKREVALEGYYANARMIGENLYFIANKSAYYIDGMKDEEILPIYKDTAISNETKMIPCTDIAYFAGTQSYTFTLVAGLNVNRNEEMDLETFFGASQTVYASENNLYLTQVNYGESYQVDKSTIYKFRLDNAQITLQCKAEINGNLNDQFSMDEYDGNLRVATTVSDGEDTSNQLYILNENMQEIGRIDNLAKGESIYAVRFIGKIGYIVTFEQIDPLFVIDLSDPTAPEVKGELKIPGYSSYLHPYDETHIIGIGYNTKSNGYGGVKNANMKMSMFDVSDLENPKEIFSIDIGKTYAYSDITSNHKVLFYHKNKNLIGFPVTLDDNQTYYARKDAFMLYKIDLEKGFEPYGEILQKSDYRTDIKRAIYIKDTLYTLSETNVIAYDLNTVEKQMEKSLK